MAHIQSTFRSSIKPTLGNNRNYFVNDSIWLHFANNFAAQLQELKVGKDDVDEIMNVVTSFQEDIVKE